MMNIIQRNYDTADHLFNNINRFFNGGIREPLSTLRKFRTYATEEAWHLRIELPGFSRDKIDLEVEEKLLKVTATPAEDDEFLSEYNQTFNLPEDAEVTNLTAKLENGILELTIPKQEEVKPEVRKIEIS